MDPQASIMNHAEGFQSPQFNLDEIWQFPINAGGAAVPYSLPPSTAAACNVSDIPTNYSGGGSARKRHVDDEFAKGVSTSGNDLSESDCKWLKTTRSDENCKSGGDGEGNSGNAEQPAKPAEPPKDYIHVRARRGQATDSHSLAERARREKISERMKVLQDIVPGCNKVLYCTFHFGSASNFGRDDIVFRFTCKACCSHSELQVIGKALVLDEIINYIQSLQHQVEFLSMKLEAVNSRTPSIEGFPAKDFVQQTFDTNAMAFGPQATREYARGTSPDWLHMQLGGGFERTT
ncbi:hypothetical protein RND71_023779 [Anisodus tanguticus]|uniref:BHLH domain-containing protein n=1 Tax=Anisodus tanguticus TaxID=243964 RepID=A0AAE1RT92_9SOLA|nr:hypothetical protein RND71_023779 [Anisodus tanguticus]